MGPSPRRLVALLLLATAAVACSSTSNDTVASSAGGAGSTPTTVPVGSKLFADNFKGACQGASMSKAKAYDAKATSHKVVLFETYKNGLTEQSTALPDDWKVTFDPNGDAYAAIDLVACSVRTSDTFVKDCDGYTHDDKPTQNIAKLHSAVYKLSVHEATTGKELGSTELTATASDCPMFVTFDSDNDTVDYYQTPPNDAYVTFLKPFVQP